MRIAAAVEAARQTALLPCWSLSRNLSLCANREREGYSPSLPHRKVARSSYIHSRLHLIFNPAKVYSFIFLDTFIVLVPKYKLILKHNSNIIQNNETCLLLYYMCLLTGATCRA